MEHGLNRLVRSLGTADPATVFISYAWEDEAAVIRIERALQERGVRVLRDKRDLPLGGDNVAVLTALIDRACDAILFYVSRHLLASDFVWRHEVPTAIGRHEREPGFHIIPVLHGRAVTFEAVATHCADRNLRPLGDFNAERVRAGLSDEDVRRIARRTLRSALALRLARRRPEEGPVALCLRTFTYTPPALAMHLDLDWTAAFGGYGPAPETWRADLTPALADVRDALAQHRLVDGVEAWLKCRLPAAVALGYAFPTKGSLPLRAAGGDGARPEGDGTDSGRSLAIRRPHGPLPKGDRRVAIVEVAISRDTTAGVTRWREAHGLRPAWRIPCTPAGGPSRAALASGAQGMSWAREIGETARWLWDREGVEELHLFLAAPAEFALLVGQHLRDRRPLWVYYGDDEAGYRLAVVLGQEAA